jgi:L-asparaginase/Glu-tRNA(Gln) amidotransferase subunit D
MSKVNNGSNGNGHGFGYSTDEDEDSEIVSSPCGERPPLDAAHVPKKLWRHSSIEACASVEARNEAKVLVLYTGGTIGMMRNEKGGKKEKILAVW